MSFKALKQLILEIPDPTWLQVTQEEYEAFCRNANIDSQNDSVLRSIFAEASNIVKNLMKCTIQLIQQKSSDKINYKQSHTKIEYSDTEHKDEEAISIDYAKRSIKTIMGKEIQTVSLSWKENGYIYTTANNQSEKAEFGDCKIEEIMMDNAIDAMRTERKSMSADVYSNGDKMAAETEIDECKSEEIKYDNEQETTPLDPMDGTIDECKNEKIKIDYKQERTKTEIKPLTVLPLTVNEIVNERKKIMQHVLETQNKLTKYEEKIIDIIGKQFELSYFRSPSLKEISFILSKATKQMQKEDKNRENFTTPNEENMMLNYLKFVDTKQLNVAMIVDDLMSKMEAHGFS